MLESSSAQARAIACACLGDLAQAHPPLQLYLSQVLLFYACSLPPLLADIRFLPMFPYVQSPGSRLGT